MTEEHEPKPTLKEEFENLGENIREALQGAWGSEERKRLSEEIERGLSEIGVALSKVADDLQQNETVQKVSNEVDDLADRVQSGEFAEKLRSETVGALHSLNEELEKWIDKWSKQGKEGEGESQS